jgi:Ser/Thr protein kinase RdoA (MazF antagonist)
MQRYYERIDPISDIDILSQKVCDEYALGSFGSSKIIELGYEDFNTLINTETGKYIIKVFKNLRSDKEAMECILRTRAAELSGIPTPKIFPNTPPPAVKPPPWS